MTALFFMCGFLATLNDILVPHLKAIFDLKYAEVMLIQFSFFSSFLIFGFPSGKLVEWIGYQGTLIVGLLTMGTGALLFIPAAATPSFPMFMSALLVLAAGVTAIQVSGNPYVSVLGSARTASSRLNLVQAFNSLGSTLAPSFGGVLILSAASTTSSIDLARSSKSLLLQVYRVRQASYVKGPYVGIATTLFVLAAIVTCLKLPRIQETRNSLADPLPLPPVWLYPQVVFGIGAIFLYCGAEIAIGSFLVNYISLPSIGAMTPASASRYVSIYWGGSMLGRFVGSAVLRRINTNSLLSINSAVALSLVATSMLSNGKIAMWSILLVGIFNSIMFPSLFTLGIAELGDLTGKASGILMSAAVGAAVIPVLQGAIADKIGVQPSFFIPALCYVYVAFYGLRGYRPVPFNRARVASTL